MQSVASRVWTRVAVSISNDDNHYTTGTSTKVDISLNKETEPNLVVRLLDMTRLNLADHPSTEVPVV